MSLGKRYKFLGTTFQTITSFGTAANITAISNANPAVVTATGSYAQGDVVKIAGIVGMEELQGVFVVSAVGSGTLTLSGVDSTNYGAYVSGGTVAKGVFSSSCEITSYTGDSGTTSETTTETNCGKAVDFGATDPGSVSVNYNKAQNDFQSAINASRKTVSDTAFKTTLVNGGGVMIDIGVITTEGNAASAGGIWTGSATLRRTQERVDLA